MKKTIQIIIVLVSSFLLSSCNTKDTICPEEQISPFRIGFKRTIDSTTNNYVVYLTLPSESGSINDTIYHSATAPGYVYLPVDITSDSTWFYIDFIYYNKADSSTLIKTDTISYTYTSEPILNNLDCGFSMEFKLDTFYYTNNHIDTAFLKNKLINSDKLNHVEIYY